MSRSARLVHLCVASLAACVLAAPLAVEAEIPGEVEASMEEFLGGACRTDLGSEALRDNSQALRKQIRAAQQRGELTKAAALQKQRTLLSCANPRAWSGLASVLLAAGEEAEAVRGLEFAFDLGHNSIEEYLDGDGSDLAALRGTDAFEQSSLARKMAAGRASYEMRHAAARKRLRQLAADDRPPLPWITKDICPFECCQYGDWSVEKDTMLYRALGDKEPVGRAMQGSTVEAVTGDVYVSEAVPIVVVDEIEIREYSRDKRTVTFVPGDLLFFLFYTGEGWGRAWGDGRELIVESSDVQNQCPHPSRRCWGEYLEPIHEPPQLGWWVQIRLPDGTLGWTAETHHFGNSDGCS